MEAEVKIRDEFWSPRIEKICREIIPYQYEVLNDAVAGIPHSHAIENFRIAAGESDDQYEGMLFQDSDVAKWIEAAAWSLRLCPDRELEEKIDSLVDLMQRAQREDGYLNTYYICTDLEKRLTNFSHGHELYCAGHLIEAAVAYALATGKEKMLHMMERYVEFFLERIGAGEGKLHGYSGHPEIEMALYKLYQYTHDVRYYDFMTYLIMERGKQPSFLLKEEGFGERYKDKWFDLEYHQAHMPAWEQKAAVGHCVRAVYLYSAMADMAMETGNSDMKNALRRLWRDVVTRKMYITGAIGSEAHGECFSSDFDLPNDRAYAETCASIGLIFWAKRMLHLEKKSCYADVMELALYNGALGGISEDGKHYFYVNPLEIHPAEAEKRFDTQHVKIRREAWMGCACCPPNIARLLASLDQYVYIWEEQGRKLYVNLFIGGEILIDNGQRGFTAESSYCWNGKVCFRYHGLPGKLALYIRVPGWVKGYAAAINGEQTENLREEEGYIRIEREFKERDCITLQFEITLRKVYANPGVHADAGKAALMRGPVVYCVEEADNGKNLGGLSVGELVDTEEYWDDALPDNAVCVSFAGYRESEEIWKERLYSFEKAQKEPVRIKAIPYYLWGNRGAGEMCIWINDIG